MPTWTRTHVPTLVALLALVVAASGTAVAAGIAKDAVTSKSIKNNSVKSKDIKDRTVASVDVRDGSLESADVKDGAIGTADVQDGAIGSADVQDGALQSSDVKDETLTGTDIAEASLGIVPNAIAVNGVRITPVSLSMASTASPVQVLAEGGNTVSLDCGGSASFEVHRAASGGTPVLLTGVLSTGNSIANSLAPNDTLDVQLNDGQFTVGIGLTGGAMATLDFTAFYEVNAQGSNDCFFRGTLTRSP